MVGETNGHDRARVVRRYLSALDAHRPGRSSTKTAESLHLRMHQIDTELLSADPVRRLHLTQERIDLHAEHLRLTTGSEDAAELEKAFVRVARGYGDRHGITYSAWRQIGVDADVLAAAGIKPVLKVRPNGAAEAATPKVADAPAKGEEVAAPAPAKKAAAAAKKAPAAAKKATAAAAKNNGAASAAKKTTAKKAEQGNLLG